MNVERTLLIIKPDGIQRGLIGTILNRLESKGLKLVGLKLIRLSESQAQELYRPHVGKPFYEPLIRYMTSGPIVVSVWEGREAIRIVRKLIGATVYTDAEPGSIRGDFSMDTRHNLVHASDSPENAQRELAIVFDEGDLLDYERIDETVLYSR